VVATVRQVRVGVVSVLRLMHAVAMMGRDEPLRQSTLYQDFLAEREEILKHKWLESEKAGHDIGFEWALIDWTLRHRSGWRKWYRGQRGSLA
jgi:hypothetical protein